MNTNQGGLSDEEHDRIFRTQVLPESNLHKLSAQKHPHAVILAGQPGAGKSRIKSAVVDEFQSNLLPIDTDDQRRFVPGWEQMAQDSPYGWAERTDADASRFSRKLLEEAKQKGVNVVIDTTLGNVEGAKAMINGLQKAGYTFEIRVVAAHRLESELGIDERFTDGLQKEMHGREVTLGFHKQVYQDLPRNLDILHKDKDVDARIRIYDREGKQHYDSQQDTRLPGAALNEARTARLHEPDVTAMLSRKWGQQADFHRNLPNTVDNLGLPRHTADALLSEQAAAEKTPHSHTRFEGSATIDELVRPGAPRAPIYPPDYPLQPDMRRIAGLGALAGAGTILEGFEAARTADRIGVLLDLDNPLAARAELRESAVRTAFAGGGTAITASVIGTGSVPQVALLAADAWLLSLAAERGMQWLENRDIVNQTLDGTDWHYDGRLWKREGPVDATLDGIDNVRNTKVTASLDQSRRLSYLASGVATALAMRETPTPRDPFNLPAEAADSKFSGVEWERDPHSGNWSQLVPDAYERYGIASHYSRISATPEQAARLDAVAAAIIRDNVAKGPAGIAVHYDIAYRRHGWSQFGPMAEPVRSALESADHIQASDGTVYQRQDDGQWLGQRGSGAPAPPGIHAELEYTRQALQNHLGRHAQTLSQVPAYVARTADQQRQEHLAYAYRINGVELHPHELAGIDAALRRTEEEHGIGLGLLQIRRTPGTAASVDSPIAHFVREADGTGRIVAITGSAAIREAVKAAERDAARTVPTEQQPTPQPQRESAPTPSPADPGIDHRPAHPDQAKLDDLRGRIEQLHAQHGLSLTPQQADNAAAALLLNMTKSGVKDAARVDFSVHAPTQQVNPQGNLIVYAHYPLREYSATAAVPVQAATSTPAEASLRELESVKQQHAERDLAWQQQRERANAQEQLHGPGPMAFG